MTPRTAGPLAAVLTALAVLAAGCAPPPRDPNHLVVWTLENLPERLAAIRSVAERFTQATGITVELVVSTRTSSPSSSPPRPRGGTARRRRGAAAGGRRSLAANELLDTAATGQVVARSARDLLGSGRSSSPATGTPARRAQRRRGRSCCSTAGPVRRRRAARARAPTPTSRSGDEAEHRRRRRVHRGHRAGDAFTQQTFEHLALANGCELVDDGGTVALDSPACVAAFAFYDDLIRNHSVAGAQDVDTTRATYFAGQGRDGDLVVVHPGRAGRAARRRRAQLPAVRGGPAVPGRQHRHRHRADRVRTGASPPSSARCSPGRCWPTRTPARRRGSSTS